MSIARRWRQGDRLVIASHNRGKQAEIAALLAPFGVETTSSAILGLAEPEETGATFMANAELKARTASLASGLPALGDDSGLAVWGLDGQPGIHSARWAGQEKDFTAAMRRVERELADKDDRSCAFICALALCWPDGEMYSFQGQVAGMTVFPPRGGNGFGYDPMVQPLGYDLTFGEMSAAAKHAISHRTRAFEQLAAAVFAAIP